MELLYLYIRDDHRNIKNCEFNFSPSYTFSFDDKNKTFSLIKETNIEHWFGPNISNITAVIGKNGAGKSNMIECLINALCYQGGGIIIFKYKGVLSYSISGLHGVVHVLKISINLKTGLAKQTKRTSP